MALSRPGYSSYLTIAWPSPSEFQSLLHKLAPCTDFFELGLPARNPLYDGPTIRSTHREALRKVGSRGEALRLASRAASEAGARFIVMTYLWEHGGPRGLRSLVEDVAASGADALLLPDLLFEYPGLLVEYVDAAKNNGLQPAFFASSKFPHHILRLLAGMKPLLIYLGLQPATGASLPVAVKSNVALARELIEDSYLLAGFAIRSPETAIAVIEAGADAVVVGSELARLYKAGGAEAAAGLACAIKKALVARRG